MSPGKNAEREARGIRRLPDSLSAALDALEAESVLMEALGRDARVGLLGGAALGVDGLLDPGLCLRTQAALLEILSAESDPPAEPEAGSAISRSADEVLHTTWGPPAL